jgi:hypothetical protein
MRISTKTAAALAAVVLVAGCGGAKDNGESKKTGPDVANDAATALQQSGAVHIKGTENEDGKPGAADLQFEDKNVSGTLTVDGQSISLVGLDATSYIKAPAAFWSSQKVPAQAAAKLNNQWVKVPSSGSDSLTSEISLSVIVDEVRKPENATINPPVKKGKYNGQKVVTLTESDGSTLDVAATGKPYPLHVVDRSSNGGDLTLSNFGVRTNITAPPGALDLQQLAAG